MFICTCVCVCVHGRQVVLCNERRCNGDVNLCFSVVSCIHLNCALRLSLPFQFSLIRTQSKQGHFSHVHLQAQRCKCSPLAYISSSKRFYLTQICHFSTLNDDVTTWRFFFFTSDSPPASKWKTETRFDIIAIRYPAVC